MERLISDFFTGIVILAIFGAVNGLTMALGKKAVNAHKNGLMSYSEWTKQLTGK